MKNEQKIVKKKLSVRAIVTKGLDCSGTVRIYTVDRWYDVVYIIETTREDIRFAYEDRGICLFTSDDIIYAKNENTGEDKLLWTEIMEVYVKFRRIL